MGMLMDKETEAKLKDSLANAAGCFARIAAALEKIAVAMERQADAGEKAAQASIAMMAKALDEPVVEEEPEDGEDWKKGQKKEDPK